MIDIKKTRNNFQKLPSLKQKCDPDIIANKTVLLQQQQQQQQQLTKNTAKNIPPNSETTAALKIIRHSGREISNKSLHSSKAATTKTPSNPVREANQKFFLINDYKDQNFLKEECELAHALVAKVSKDKKNPKNSSTSSILPAVIDNRRCRSVIHGNNNNINNNTVRSIHTYITFSGHKSESVLIAY